MTIGQFKPNTLAIIKKMPTGALFKHVRGSTAGFSVESDNEIWFVCHIVSHENVRQYMHLIVVLDGVNLSIKRLSHPFKFEGQPIEYCLGLIVNDNDIVMTYSINDSSSNILIVQKSDLKFVEDY